MKNWYDDKDMEMARIMAEDAAAPELRNPLTWRLNARRKAHRAAKRHRFLLF